MNLRQLVSSLALFAFASFVSCKSYAPISEGEPADPSLGEPSDPAWTDPAAWDSLPSRVVAGFGSADVRYSRSAPAPAEALSDSWEAKAWRGEKIHTQVVVSTRKPLGRVRVECEGLVSASGAVIPADRIDIGVVRYVLTDTLSSRGRGFGLPPMEERYTALAADGIESVQRISMERRTTRPFWVSVRVPRNVFAGTYSGVVEVTAGRRSFELPVSIEVSDRLLPEPSEWAFGLDVAQNPYSVARYHRAPLWSEGHFEKMRPSMEMLAAAGQKNRTASLTDNPWGDGDYDDYRSMVRWTRNGDGVWSWDYSALDNWVEFMTGLGIGGLIDCHSVLPMGDVIGYRDEVSGRDETMVLKSGSREWRTVWGAMLADFARHLREKGWMERAAISIVEKPTPDYSRPLEEILFAVELVRAAAPEFKISFAGGFHEALALEVDHYAIAPGREFPDEALIKRKMRGLVSTFSTSSADGHPNTFTFSPPAESAWMGWHAAAMGLDGYVRMGYNSWPEDPLHDSRYGTGSAGDTYLVYPDGRSSICFERLIEGIQGYEKVRILRRKLGAFELEELEGVLVPLTEHRPSYLVSTFEEVVENAMRQANEY
jgi:hypothetical protein